LTEVNQRVSYRGLNAMTTAAVVAYYSNKCEVCISYAGHPPALYKRTTNKAWPFATPSDLNVQSEDSPVNLPLAVISDTFYGQFAIKMTSGDRLFVYTDGIIETPSPKGDLFGFDRLKNVLDANTNSSLSEIKSAVLKALNKHAKKGLTHDDVTLISLEIC
jgi:sigma-B regulation protein RsbU (phosphoserine phosphatase)